MERGGRARSLLADLARQGDEAILWRGSRVDGRDVDLVVLPRAETGFAADLARAGYRPSRRPCGRTVWSAPDGAEPDIDVTPSRAWPDHYPSLAGVRSRAAEAPGLPPVASPEDRLLILAVEAVAGRPLAKAVERANGLLATPGVATRLAAVASEEGMPELGRLIADPGRLAAMGRRGRLPYRRALALASRSGAARAALRCRIEERGRRAARRFRGRPGRGRDGLLIALSGMDGAGKSTAAQAIRAHLEAAGHPAVVRWGRVAVGLGPLSKVAAALRRLLRRRGSVADPVAAGHPTPDQVQQHRKAGGRRSVVSWIWVVLVAVANARHLRAAARPTRSGVAVVSDRWLIDSLVDLEVRYGRHRVAAWAVAWATPRADAVIFLEVDAATSARRKPGDQAPRVLLAMERHYRSIVARHDLIRIEASPPRTEVDRAVREVVDSILERRSAEGR